MPVGVKEGEMGRQAEVEEERKLLRSLTREQVKRDGAKSGSGENGYLLQKKVSENRNKLKCPCEASHLWKLHNVKS